MYFILKCIITNYAFCTFKFIINTTLLILIINYKMVEISCLSIDLLIFFGSAVKIRPKEGDVYFDVVAVVDPVTRDAQKLAPLLLVR